LPQFGAFGVQWTVMTSIGIAARDGEAMAQASAWVARLQRAEVGEADGLEFDAWLAAAPENRAAYARALAAWRAFDGAEDQVLGALAADARRSRAAPTRRWLAGGVGLAAAAGLALAVLPQITAQPSVETYQTARGEHRKVTLADGSVVDLNAETRLTVTLARSERRVALAAGEAIFDVTADKGRPFTVAAAGREVRVVGTQFEVRHRQGQLTVTVAEGRVQVRPGATTPKARSFTLDPGQRLAVDREGVEQLAAVDPQETFSWRSGRLVYRGQPLGEVVADLNRQFTTQIEIADPELARIPITGVIVLDDAHSVADRLALMLPVRSVPSERGLLLQRK
jgi:transmembrane sensor